MTVVGCTGHQSLSPATRLSVAAAMEAELKRYPPPVVGVCSLAVGADQIFADKILAVGGELHAVIPSEGYADTFSDEARPRYNALLAAVTAATTLSYPTPGEQAYLAAGKRVVEACDVLMAVWDGAPAAGLGGTADVVDYAHACGREVVVVWPPGSAR